MRRVCAAALAVLLLFSSGCGRTERADAPLSYRISNAGEVVASIRRGLKNHARTVTVTFSYGEDIFDELNGVIDDWVEAALAETDEPDEGDYIRYQYGGYTWTSSYTVEAGRLHYTVKLTPSYYCYLSQEEEASTAAKELVRGFRFRPWTSDYEKLRTVYDWLCRNVTYDKVHRKNPYYHLCSTAYAALVQHTAACQGYCTALYRLLREAGISLASAEYEVREDGDATVITVIHYPAVTVRYDGQEAVVSMREGTVADVLAALGIALAEGDRVVPGLDERITDGMTVEVERAG